MQQGGADVLCQGVLGTFCQARRVAWSWRLPCCFDGLRCLVGPAAFAVGFPMVTSGVVFFVTRNTLCTTVRSFPPFFFVLVFCFCSCFFAKNRIIAQKCTHTPRRLGTKSRVRFCQSARETESSLHKRPRVFLGAEYTLEGWVSCVPCTCAPV